MSVFLDAFAGDSKFASFITASGHVKFEANRLNARCGH